MEKLLSRKRKKEEQLEKLKKQITQVQTELKELDMKIKHEESKAISDLLEDNNLSFEELKELIKRGTENEEI